ncbi:class I SAM-dependent methyltransferase [candidate division KSB1 bacterium]|nr:class I SAM-dependent methyltransferase [candidate division KSB1 bacterium]
MPNNAQGGLKKRVFAAFRNTHQKFLEHPFVARAISNQFHKLYYHSPFRPWLNTHWLGIPILKCPLDVWIYQEIIHETKPDVIIECGTYKGGSALFFASLFDYFKHGRVITIDIQADAQRPQHDRITYLLGSSIAPEVVARARALLQPNENIMVVLDSDHSMSHVLQEMKIYSDLVPLGGYMIVEDTNVNGHPVAPQYGPGPMEAVQAFLRENDSFVVDKAREKFFMSFNPNGYLKKIKNSVRKH